MGKSLNCLNTGRGEGQTLSGRPFCIVHGKTIKGQLIYSQIPADMIELQAGGDSVGIAVLLGKAFPLGSPAVAVGYDSNMFRDSGHGCLHFFL